MELLGDLFREILMRPMANSLVLLYLVLFNNFGLSVIVFTVLIRLATMQLTLKQVKSTRAMSTLQPKMKELQARYKSDRQKLSSETFKLYKEHGVNPIGCLGPLVIQFPIWIGLYWAPHPRVAVQSGKPRGPVPAAVRLAAHRAQRGARRQHLPLAGPGGA